MHEERGQQTFALVFDTKRSEPLGYFPQGLTQFAHISAAGLPQNLAP
jgi:hypothetical protein